MCLQEFPSRLTDLVPQVLLYALLVVLFSAAYELHHDPVQGRIADDAVIVDALL